MKVTNHYIRIFANIFMLLSACISINIYAGTIPNPANLTDETVLDWAKTTAAKIRSYDFVHSDLQFDQAEANFCSKSASGMNAFKLQPGWDSYYQTIWQSGEIAIVKNLFLYVVAEANGSPTIIKKGNEQSGYSWTIEVPLSIKYVSSQGKVEIPSTMVMVATRCNTNAGVCVSEFFSKDHHQDNIKNALCDTCFK